MDEQFFTLLAVAGAAALASPIGGLVAIVVRPTSLYLSLAVGFAGGVLLGTFGFEMLPEAIRHASVAGAVAGFLVGLALIYGLDLFINRGAMAGSESDQKRAVDAFHRRRPPLGGRVTVLAGATSAEEFVEGITIGVGAAISPGAALVVGISILIDNFSEALSIGELLREEEKQRYRREIMKWTSLIGLSLFVSAMIGWFLLHDLPGPVLGFLLAGGAGGMFYLTVTDLVPEAQRHQYEGSGALAIAAGFIVSLILTQTG
jgi:ZIP family zinc transporter